MRNASPLHYGDPGQLRLCVEAQRFNTPTKRPGIERDLTFNQKQRHAETGPGMFGFGGFSGAGDNLNSLKGSSFGEGEDAKAKLTPQEIIHCAKSVGVTIERSNDGWNPLVKFVQAREKEN